MNVIIDVAYVYQMPDEWLKCQSDKERFKKEGVDFREEEDTTQIILRFRQMMRGVEL